MSTAVISTRLDSNSIADTALKASARLWFVVTVIGQVIFGFAVASFYALTAVHGDYYRWNKCISRGHVAGDTMGNFAVVAHVTAGWPSPTIKNRWSLIRRTAGQLRCFGN